MTDPGPRDPEEASAESADRIDRLLHYRVFWLLGLIILGLDQVTKIWIQHTLPEGTYGPDGWIPVLPGLLYWVHVHNTGAAWGLFADGALFLAGLAVIVLALLFRFRRALDLGHRYNQVVFGLIVGGILGNLVDRVLYGHVVDFIDVHLPLINYRWPAFNIADSGICVGVLLYALAAFFPRQILGAPAVGSRTSPAGDQSNGGQDQTQ
ncbi:MAG: signal peptidase II [Opitutales bacterium]